MPQVKAILIGRPPRYLQLAEYLTVRELKTTLQEEFAVENLTVVFKGSPLTEELQEVHFHDGDALLVTVIQSASSHHPQEVVEDPDADITFRLDDSASPLKKWMYRFCANTLRMPNLLLYWIFSIRLRYYFLFVVWMVLSPVAARFDLGPVYILATIFLLIVVNLGVRREGELSGYSLFNDNVQSLPGQLNADQIDQQIRHGRM